MRNRYLVPSFLSTLFAGLYTNAPFPLLSPNHLFCLNMLACDFIIRAACEVSKLRGSLNGWKTHYQDYYSSWLAPWHSLDPQGRLLYSDPSNADDTF